MGPTELLEANTREVERRRAAADDERERIAACLNSEADVCPCQEDALVLREAALLVRANFSYEEAERLAGVAPRPSWVVTSA